MSWSIENVLVTVNSQEAVLTKHFLDLWPPFGILTVTIRIIAQY